MNSVERDENNKNYANKQFEELPRGKSSWWCLRAEFCVGGFSCKFNDNFRTFNQLKDGKCRVKFSSR